MTGEGIRRKDHQAITENTIEMVDDMSREPPEDTTEMTADDSHDRTLMQKAPQLLITDEGMKMTEARGGRITLDPLGPMDGTKKRRRVDRIPQECLPGHMGVGATKRNEELIRVVQAALMMLDTKIQQGSLRRTNLDLPQHPMIGATDMILVLIETTIDASRQKQEDATHSLFQHRCPGLLQEEPRARLLLK
mmetsp:Transcript_27820/g.67341  ORF Transcript_27820/g.67341 Transcript_27820/m.67341 type:complete len:192 (-) Transcript_27820:1199-1774(-)